LRKSRFYVRIFGDRQINRGTNKQTDRQTHKQMDSRNALSRLRYRERRLNNSSRMMSDRCNWLRALHNAVFWDRDKIM